MNQLLAITRENFGEMLEAKRHDTGVDKLMHVALAAVSDANFRRWMRQDLSLLQALFNPEYIPVIVAWQLILLEAPDDAYRH